MKIYNKPGSKERLFEMMNGVTKNQLNENIQTPETKEIVNMAFTKLANGALTAEQGGSVEAKMLDNYIGINGYDSEGNMYNFNFKLVGREGDQQGVEMVNDVILERFYFQNPQGEKVIELDENDLQDFNNEHGAGLFDVIEQYVDITPPEPESDFEQMSEFIDKKPESDPFGGARQKYQDGMGYGDEKPVNPKLRVDAPELHKFVREDDMAEREEKSVDQDTLDGEQLLKAKQSSLAADIEYAKLAKAYENFLKVKQIEFKPSEVLQKALSAARDLITEYLQTVKGLNVTEEDVQNHFQEMLGKYGNVVAENEEEEVTPDVEKENPEGWKDVDGTFTDQGGIMKWTEKQKEDGGEEDAVAIEVPAEEPAEEPSFDPEDKDGDGDMIPGGLADDADVATYDPEQVLKGMEVEMEHTDDPKVALEIAMDHLEEFGDYYTRLDSMEKEAEADSEVPEDAPEDLKGHFDDIDSADKELEDAMLGFKTNTPNANKDEQ